MSIYVLELDDGHYYVGKTEKPVEVRFQEHRRGSGAEWTRIHPPINISKVYPTEDANDELKITIKMMRQYGIDKVRGSSHCKPILDAEERRILDLQISAPASCYKCRQSVHFAK